MPPGSQTDIVGDTQRFWARRTAEQLSPEEAREAIFGVTAFCELLSRWDAISGGSGADEADEVGHE